MKRALVLAGIVVFVLLAGAIGGGAIRFGGSTDTGATGVSLLVTRDFGTREIESSSSGSVPSNETVMRYLQRHTDVETRYGGGFVQSIEGLSGDVDRRVDWFYYVNGIEAPRGAASRKISEGDSIWWDRHYWGSAQRIPAVVGSWPEPFLTGEQGRNIPLQVVCGGERRACEEVQTRLEDEGVKAVSASGLGTGGTTKVLRIFVGPWDRIRSDPAVAQLERGPSASGVYARPGASGIDLLDERGKVVRTLTDAGGLIAATSFQNQQPTWIVTGTDNAGVAAAAASLREDVLKRHFAVAIDQGRPVGLPVQLAQ
jgi:hypothetical protein